MDTYSTLVNGRSTRRRTCGRDLTYCSDQSNIVRIDRANIQGRAPGHAHQYRDRPYIQVQRTSRSEVHVTPRLPSLWAPIFARAFLKLFYQPASAIKIDLTYPGALGILRGLYQRQLFRQYEQLTLCHKYSWPSRSYPP